MFLIESISRLFCRGEIFISARLWGHLLQSLKERSNGCRESGAFLLGNRVDYRRYIKDFVLYDDLSPGCLHYGYILFDGAGYSELWRICREQNMSVVADIHVHPGRAFMSETDRDNPMIPDVGHCALILPNYAQTAPKLDEIGIYRRIKGGRWQEMKKRAFRIEEQDK